MVKLKAICVIGGAEGRAPARMRAFVNRDDLDFAAVAAAPPAQEWDLQEVNTGGMLEYPTQCDLASFSMYLPPPHILFRTALALHATMCVLTRKPR